MAKVYSNIFNLNTTSTDEVVNDFTEKIDVKTLYTDYALNFKNELSKLLKSFKFTEINDFEEIELNLENFQDYHLDIFSNPYLLVTYDFNYKAYKYILPNGKIFKTTVPKVIKIINSVPTTNKFTYDAVPLQDCNNIVSFKMLTLVLFNIRHDSLYDILCEFKKDTVEITNKNEDALLIHLYKIFPRLVNIISKHRYWKYIHLENKVYHARNERNYSLNDDDLLYIKGNLARLEKNLLDIAKTLNMSNNDFKNRRVLLEYVALNTEFFPSINENVLKATKDDTLLEFMKLFTAIKPLPKIDVYNITGNCSSLPIHVNITNKHLIKCSYNDIYFKILAMLTHNKELIDITNKGSLIATLLENTSNLIDNNKALTIYLEEEFIKAKVLGLKSAKEIVAYFEKVLNIVIIQSNFEILNNLYNNELSIISNEIKAYNSNKYISNDNYLITHKKVSHLHKAIYTYIRNINKNLIAELIDYCTEFNQKNKSKFYVYHFNSEEVYILSSEGALNAAMDTVSRIMPVIFNNYCAKLLPEINVNIIDTLEFEDETITSEE